VSDHDSETPAEALLSTSQPPLGHNVASVTIVTPIIMRFVDTPDADALDAARGMFSLPASVETKLGALGDAGLVLAGSVAIPALASQLVALACRLRRKGLIVDARLDPLEIFEVDHLPGGTVVVINGDGSSDEYNVCGSTVDLAAILGALTSSK
jgi:hypothetical protein